MPKTNAFALRDFDKEKILSRNFFDNLGADGRRLFPKNIPDNEILKSFECVKNDSEEILNEKSEQVTKFIFVVHEFLIFLQRHLQRLSRFSDSANFDLQNAESEITHRANILIGEYGEVDYRTTELLIRLETITQNLKDAIDRRRFGERLKLARLEMKLSRNALAKLIRANQSDIADFETGKKFPSVYNLIRLVRTTHKSATWLLNLK